MGATGAAPRFTRAPGIILAGIWAALAADPAFAQTAPPGSAAQGAQQVPAASDQFFAVQGPYGPYSDVRPGQTQWSTANTPYANLPQGYYSAAPLTPLRYDQYPKPPSYVPAYRRQPPQGGYPPPTGPGAQAPYPPPPGYAAPPSYSPPPGPARPVAQQGAPPPGPAVQQPPPPGPATQQRVKEVAARPAADRHYREPLAGIVTEAILDFADHDAGIFGNGKEPGEDVGFEVRFLPIDWLDVIASPRPNIGAHINIAGATSQIYTGIVWEFWFWENFYVNPAFGLSFNDGDKLTEESTNRKQLGSHVLFREALEIGWNFYGPHSISIFLDHVSHGTMFSSKNEGMDDLGGRYSYRF